MVSIADEARTDLLAELGLTEPQLLTNADLMRLLLEGDEGLTNLVTNGDLDTDITGWRRISSEVTVEHTAERFFSSGGALKLTNDTAAAVDAGIRPTAANQAAVIAGNNYQWSGWVFAPVGWDTVIPSIVWFDSVGGVISNNFGSTVDIPAGEWTFIVQERVAPTGAVEAQPRFNIRNSPPVGLEVYFDQLRFFDATADGSLQTLHRPLVGTSVGTELWRFLESLR